MADISSFAKVADSFGAYVKHRLETDESVYERYGEIHGYELDNDMILCTNGVAVAFLLDVDERRAVAIMEKHGIPDRRNRTMVYHLALAYPFGGMAKHTLKTASLADTLKEVPEDANAVCLPDGTICQKKLLQDVVTFFNTDETLEMKTVPYERNGQPDGDLVMMRNRAKDAFFYLRPLDPDEVEGKITNYAEKVTKEDLVGTLFDLL